MTIYAAYLAFTLLLAGLAWYPCCCGGVVADGTCAYCAGAGTPSACFAVYISGMADDSCSDCESYDGTYITGKSQVTGLGYCLWSFLDEDVSTCSVDTIGVDVQYGTASPNHIQVIFTQIKGGFRNQYYWRKTSPGTLDCLAIASLDIPYYTRTVAIGDAGVSCNASSATCEISAVSCS